MLDGQLERNASSAAVAGIRYRWHEFPFPPGTPMLVAVPHGTSKMVAAFCGVRAEGPNCSLSSDGGTEDPSRTGTQEQCLRKHGRAPMQHPIVSREEWLIARAKLLAREKAVMKAQDALV